MIVISHRGNIEGSNKDTENNPHQVESVIKQGYDCEIDLRVDGGNFFLGHDEPKYKISIDWLMTYQNSLWIHCKSFMALTQLINYRVELNFFWHESDDFTLTSHGYIWTFPGKNLGSRSIAVLPEKTLDLNSLCPENFINLYGVCTDFPQKIRTFLT
jgi:hypothetical protein